jgi:predicted ATPase
MTQEQALAILMSGKNAFITGAAGSGKTFLLNRYIGWLAEAGVAVAVTASTGIAATHLNGITLHSWTGMGVRDGLSERDVKDLIKRGYLRRRFLGTRVLVIDEISMLAHYQLDMADQLFRAFKQVDEPFGGVQVVLCGDFFQLPPIIRRRPEAPEEAAKMKTRSQASMFAQDENSYPSCRRSSGARKTRKPAPQERKLFLKRACLTKVKTHIPREPDLLIIPGPGMTLI